MKLIDLTGMVFGRLTVRSRASANTNSGHPKWDCACSCGAVTVVPGTDLRNGHTTSCGCFNKEVVVAMRTKHGECGSATYRSWMAMFNRCRNPAAKDYQYYGGRGVAVCDRWYKFENFLADMGPRPAGQTIDRVDVDGPYSPENCKWATHAEQMQNTRASVRVDVDGQTLCLRAACERLGTSYKRVRGRLQLGWPMQDALSLPIMKGRHYANAKRGS